IIIFIKALFTNEALLRHLNSAPPRTSSNLTDVSTYLVTYSKNEVEIFGLIYLWVTGNISYDATSYFSNVFPDQNGESVFKTGLAVCAGYASLFSEMCKIA